MMFVCKKKEINCPFKSNFSSPPHPILYHHLLILKNIHPCILPSARRGRPRKLAVNGESLKKLRTFH